MRFTLILMHENVCFIVYLDDGCARNILRARSGINIPHTDIQFTFLKELKYLE